MIELGSEMLGFLTCSFRGFFAVRSPRAPVGRGTEVQESSCGVRQMPEGVLEEKPALGAFWGGMANLQDQERNEKEPIPVHYKISHTLRKSSLEPSKREGGLKSDPGQ